MIKLKDIISEQNPALVDPDGTIKGGPKKDDELNEDGHTDVASAKRKMKLAIEDAKQLLERLETMDSEGDLPSWWMGKVTLASDYLNKCRDYLLNPGDETAEYGGDAIKEKFNIRKQSCKQSDGDAGTHVISYRTKKGKMRRACHTSKKRAKGQIAAIEAPPR